MRKLHLALGIVLAFVAAVGGVFVGRALFPVQDAGGTALHDVLHHQLSLDAAQEQRIAALETQFAARRRALELELRAANARLAEAIAAEHAAGPRVAAAVDQSHAAMGALQKATLAHLFAMRRLLRPDQAARFDAAVVKALTDGRG
jgi:hypothetical protein